MANNTYQIKNADDLKAEIQRLRILRDQQEQQLKESFDALHESMNVENITKLAFQSLMKNVKTDENIAKQGIMLGAHVLVDDILFRNKGSVTKFVAENVVKLAANFLLKKRAKTNSVKAED
ncbi:MAG: hypothetical protein ACKVPJ_07785 [Chitinophagales bacterium]